MFSYYLLRSSEGSLKSCTWNVKPFIIWLLLSSIATLSPHHFHALPLFVQNQLSHSWYSSFHARMKMTAGTWNRSQWCPSEIAIYSPAEPNVIWHCSAQFAFPFHLSSFHQENICSSSELSLYHLYEAFPWVSKRIERNLLLTPIILCIYLNDSTNNTLTVFIGVPDCRCLEGRKLNKHLFRALTVLWVKVLHNQ